MNSPHSGVVPGFFSESGRYLMWNLIQPTVGKAEIPNEE